MSYLENCSQAALAPALEKIRNEQDWFHCSYPVVLSTPGEPFSIRSMADGKGAELILSAEKSATGGLRMEIKWNMWGDYPEGKKCRSADVRKNFPAGHPARIISRLPSTDGTREIILIAGAEEMRNP